MYLGDFAAGAVFDLKFTTRRFTTGVPFALSSGAISVYKNNDVSQSTSGVTLSADFDGVTGLNNVRIDLSSDGTFYAAGSNFQVVITTGTVDSVSVVGEVVAQFSIANRPLQSIGANVVTAASLASDAGNEIADAVLNRDMSTGTDSGSTTVRTPRQALRFLRNKWSISGTTLTVTKEDDSTASWSSEVTTSGSADPIVANDPAGP